MINRLIGRKRLAKTSSKPGRTQAINFYDIDGRWVFVDLPGYGYAKVAKQVRAGWAPMIEEFLENHSDLKLAILIVDARHRPSELDRQMKTYLENCGIDYRIVATKSDKLSANQRRRSIDRAREFLGVNTIVPFSAATGRGKKELWHIIREVCTHG